MVRDFMNNAWAFFRGVVFEARKYGSKLDYIGAIEDDIFAER